MPLDGDEAYCRFLRVQYRARLPIEAWLADHADAALQPPPQTGLIAADLHELNCNIASAPARFDADPSGATGIVWVLAGSALGNKAMLKQREKHGCTGPHRFLASANMQSFFYRLLSYMNDDIPHAGPQPAINAARAAFAFFTDIAEQELAGPTQ